MHHGPFARRRSRMETTNKARMFRIGGKLLPERHAALMCQEADRLNVVPGKVGSVTVPRDVPELVTVAGHSLTVFSAASLAEEADRLGQTPGDTLVRVLESLYGDPKRASRRARTRETRRTLAGTWVQRVAPCR